jgi:hypothetical protein
MNLRRVYAVLLRLYPREYRALFGREMLAVFDRAAEESRKRGWASYVGFVLAELIGLLKGVAAEWSAPPNEVTEAEKRIELDIKRTVHAIAHHDFPKARFYWDQERKHRANLQLLREKYNLP